MKTVIFDKTGTLTIGKPIVVGTKLFTSVRLHVFYDTIAAAEVTSSLLTMQKHKVLFNNKSSVYANSTFHACQFLSISKSQRYLDVEVVKNCLDVWKSLKL